MMNYSLNNKRGFTLAEVLITLAIIGVVAALMIHVLTSKIQDIVLKNQFKKTYSLLKSTIIGIQSENGMPLKCYYWASDAKKPYTCTSKCITENDNGACIAWVCSETNEPIPSNYNGEFSECMLLDEELFFKKLKVAKYCENNALSNGCITADYKSADKVTSEQNPNSIFSDTNIKTQYPVFVLADGTIIIRFNRMGSSPIYAFDINGTKAPNKWGYDIFAFNLRGYHEDGIKLFQDNTVATANGGRNLFEMLKVVGLK